MSFIDRYQKMLKSFSNHFTVEAMADEIKQQWIEQALTVSHRHSIRKCKMPAEFTVWFVTLMGLFRRISYVNLLEKCALSVWAQENWGVLPPDDSGVSKARDRLGVEPLRILYRRAAREWFDSTPGLIFHGRRVMAIDGTTAKVPDTGDNVAGFGKPPSSRGTTGYPQLRMVGLTDVGSGMLVAERNGGYFADEQSLTQDMLEDIPENSLVIFDRGFVNYPLMWRIVTDRQCDIVLRLKSNNKVRVVKWLRDGDAIVEIDRKQSKNASPDMPNAWRMRLVTYTPPDGTKRIRLLTTLTDPTIHRDELAELYHCRWECETSFDALKTHLCGSATITRPTVFRSKNPERVIQEYYGLLLAFNLISLLLVRRGSTRDPRAESFLSFTAGLERVREAVQDMFQLPTRFLAARYKRMLRAIDRAVVPKRPGRKYPRAVKIKMSSYKLKRHKLIA